MPAAGLPLTETGYTSLARMAASAGDGAAALAAAQSMVAAGISPRLRSFTPALLAFSTAGQVGRTGAPQSCQPHPLQERREQHQPPWVSVLMRDLLINHLASQ